jgi:hypothetical protein
MKKLLALCVSLFFVSPAFCWGFYGHGRINHYAVFLLPPEMMILYKSQIQFLEEHAADPDKRRYAVAEEGPRHFIDIDHYGSYPFPLLPNNWNKACERYSEDTLKAHGIVPWHIQNMMGRLTKAFRELNYSAIMKNSAELGHYIADAHVPLHASSNHNGQLTGQKGIHGFWESRVPELLAEKQFDFLIGKAEYIRDTEGFIWSRVLESANAADSVLSFERALTLQFPIEEKYAFEERNGKMVKQYSSEFTIAYDQLLKGMVERRMRQAIYAVASFWYTAWVNAGQPDLKKITDKKWDEQELRSFEWLNSKWKAGSDMIGRQEE